MSAGKNRRKSHDYTSSNKVRLVQGGKEYFDCLIHMIETANESIHLQTYIFNDDETGQKVSEALKAAAKRKVQVFVMVDGFASRSLSPRFIADMRNAGILFRSFEPFFRSKYFYFGRRLHHKMTVTDTRYVLTGGINIADRYNDFPAAAAWLDFALYAEGEVAKELCILCWKTWNGYPPTMGPTPCEQQRIEFDFPAEDACKISIRRNDWVRRKNEISSTYVNMFRNAQSHITILCSYFLPGRVIRRQIAAAASRGVRITVITAGASDVWMTKHAERYMYKWLLQHNVDIYEYRPGVLHGKITVCDGSWLTIGSYNINNLSAYASIELNMNVYHEAFARGTEQLLLKIATRDCIQVTKEYSMKPVNIFQRFTRWFSYEFINLGLYLSTFYFKHKT